MRSRVPLAALLTLAFVCFTNGMAKADAAETAKQESVSVFGEANLQIPAEFKRVEPKFNMIKHEFQAKSGDGDNAETARVTMMSASGGIDGNIKRWKEQFVGGDADAQKTEELKLGDWKVHIVDVSGSYAERMGGGPFAGGKVVNHENYAMTGAIVMNPDGGANFFVKMIGPEKVVKANREAFVKMIKSIQQ